MQALQNAVSEGEFWTSACLSHFIMSAQAIMYKVILLSCQDRRVGSLSKINLKFRALKKLCEMEVNGEFCLHTANQMYMM